MAQKKRKNKKPSQKRQPSKKNSQGKNFKYPILTSRLKRWIVSVILFATSLIIGLSFFEKAGIGGRVIFRSLYFLVGKTVFFLPGLLVLGGLLFLKPPKKRIFLPIFGGILIIIFGITGLFQSFSPHTKPGGIVGFLVSWIFVKYLGSLVSFIVFATVILIGGLILWEFLPKHKLPEKEKTGERPLKILKSPIGERNQTLKPKFEVKVLEPRKKKEILSTKKERSFEKESGDFSTELRKKYLVPPLSFFDVKEEKPSSGDIEYNRYIIKKTLQNFGIEVEMGEVNIGPTVTQYTLKPAEGVKLSKITSLSNDLALALASHPIRIEAPIPGKPLVGIEVPNKIRANVKIGNLISLKEFQNHPSSLIIALGKDVMGNPVFPDLEKMPHLLVAGSTGSGKTVCLNSIILSLIYRNPPKILRLILIDPKRVEFPVYSSLPHLLTPVIYEPQKVINALNWLVKEMERRFEILKEAGARDIISYNQNLKKKPKLTEEGFEIMPYIVLVIDELADLMAARGREIEGGIVRLSQMARAVGIHLVVATQRPSVEVITGLIKANITSRIAFQVASQVDSRTILDTAGAEKLLGRGDMLFLSPEYSKPKRIQGSFVSGYEVRKVVQFIAKENPPEEKEEIEEELKTELEKSSEISTEFEEDPLYEKAREIVIEYQKASASLLQRRLKIGYARAARILDMLEERGVIGPADGAKPREVYIKPEKEGDSLLDKEMPL